jgi:elongation factor P
MRANDLKPGVALDLNGKLYVVMKTDHVKPGKGPAYIQAKMRAVDGSGTTERRFSGSDPVDATILDKRDLEFLYPDGSGGGTFMDTESFDQTDLSAGVLGDALMYLAPNSACTVLFHNDAPLLVELPASVELTVADTTPGVKTTAANQSKDAVVHLPRVIELTSATRRVWAKTSDQTLRTSESIR